jgi:hypothetical protein
MRPLRIGIKSRTAGDAAIAASLTPMRAISPAADRGRSAHGPTCALARR